MRIHLKLYCFTFLFLACLNGMAFSQTSQALKLWYTKPAANWNEALPVGNGFMGAMIFGGVEKEQLQLNENTLYSGEPSNVYKNVDITKTYDTIVGLIKQNKNAEAQSLVKKHWLGRLHHCYQPLGDLFLTFAKTGKVENYRRDLDISKAIATTIYKIDGVTYKREVFASNPDRVIVIKISADKPGAVEFDAELSSVHPTAKPSMVDNQTIKLYGQAPGYAERRTFEQMEAWGDQYKHPEIYDEKGNRKFQKNVFYGDEIGGLGTFFESRLKVSAKKGEITADAKGLHVRKADEVVLILSAATSFNGFDKSPSKEGIDCSAKAAGFIEKTSGTPYNILLKKHVDDYSSLFNRVRLDLGINPAKESLPTDQRILRLKESPDNGLIALTFQYGRYLMISASRVGGQPTNLQGMWSDLVIPPWNGGYTININAQMNYWPSEITNLSDCTEPFFRMIKEISVNGRETATKMYGRKRGWVAHHNVSIWRETFTNDNDPRASFWLMSPGWLCSHLWEHYIYTGNLNFLKNEAYPLMRGAAEFCLDWLVDNGKGQLVTPVSTSPENLFLKPDSSSAAVTTGATMDMAIIRELFSRTIRATEILKTDDGFRLELKQSLAKLLPYKIGFNGQLQEWEQDYRDEEPQHRHISHLYPLYPGNQINAETTPELNQAVIKTLNLRGDEGTGWSMGWKISTWARLYDGDRAYKVMNNFFAPVDFGDKKNEGGGIYMNLFDACPPMQIDGNFGFTAGIAEMLVQSHAGYIQLLPAIPSAWPEGKITGLKCRGGFEIKEMQWKNGKLVKAVIKSTLGGNCRIRTSTPVKIANITFKEASGANANPYFEYIHPGKPEINEKATLPATQSLKYYTIDFETVAGKEYEIY